MVKDLADEKYPKRFELYKKKLEKLGPIRKPKFDSSGQVITVFTSRSYSKKPNPIKLWFKKIRRYFFLTKQEVYRKQYDQTVLDRQKKIKKECSHLRSDKTYNIHWHEHSNEQILGVCGTCNSRFDTRNPEDRKLLMKDPWAINHMGRVGRVTPVLR